MGEDKELLWYCVAGNNNTNMHVTLFEEEQNGYAGIASKWITEIHMPQGLDLCKHIFLNSIKYI